MMLLFISLLLQMICDSSGEEINAKYDDTWLKDIRRHSWISDEIDDSTFIKIEGVISKMTRSFAKIYQDDISFLKNKILNLEDRNEHLERQVSSMKNIFEEVKLSKSKNAHTDTTLAKCKSVESEVNELKRRNGFIEKELQALKTEIKHTRQYGNKSDEKVNSSAERQQKIRQDFKADVGDGAIRNTKAAFSAQLHDNIYNVRDSDTIVIDQIITNLGYGYNSSTGIFTCPSPGMYVFYHNLEVDRDHYFYTMLIKNGQLIGHNVAAGENSSDVGSGLTVVSLNQGDKVWIAASAHSADSIVYPAGTTFSGFQI